MLRWPVPVRAHTGTSHSMAFLAIGQGLCGHISLQYKYAGEQCRVTSLPSYNMSSHLNIPGIILITALSAVGVDASCSDNLQFPCHNVGGNKNSMAFIAISVGVFIFFAFSVWRFGLHRTVSYIVLVLLFPLWIWVELWRQLRSLCDWLSYQIQGWRSRWRRRKAVVAPEEYQPEHRRRGSNQPINLSSHPTFSAMERTTSSSTSTTDVNLPGYQRFSRDVKLDPQIPPPAYLPSRSSGVV